MTTRLTIFLTSILVGYSAWTRPGNFTTEDALQRKQAWFKQHWLAAKTSANVLPASSTPPPTPCLEVLANHDAVWPNSRGGQPMKIGVQEYRRGLYCHAVSKIVVRLLAPAKTFTAVVGLDHNDDTRRGKGSVVFSVTVSNRVAFKSPILRYGSPALPVAVELGGADTFTLEISDAGDGIGWDQSDWAEAKVTMADGKEVWLGDLPIRDDRAGPRLAPMVRGGDLPFSFVYGGEPSDNCLAKWPRRYALRRLDTFRTEHTFTWTDPVLGLEVRAVAVDYRDYPAIEWTVYFKNTGPLDSPILENLQALDARFVRQGTNEFVLHCHKGDWCAPQSYEPYDLVLAPASTNRFAPDGGRATNGPKGWPYYNLQMPGGGVMLAIGWPGQWASTFLRDRQNGLRVLAGQEYIHLRLRPGEEIRTPLIALVFWEGNDVGRAQNLWRRWFLAHNIPRLNGQIPPPMLQMQCYRTFEKGGEQDLFDTVKEFTANQIPFDLCWRDAGWYPCKGSWPNTGTWEIDPARYPRGFRPFSDWLHQQGKKFIVWFEPERVGDRESWLAKQHPEWILGGSLLNLGNSDARIWLTEHIDKMLREQGIDYYRQDFNMDPLGNWRGHDAPDRRGITEIQHVTGYLAFWDELRRRHPGMLIDSCASGGRRNDLETLRRAVPLLRSDFQFGREATMPNQGHTYGISSWIPYYGSGCYFTEPYDARSYIMPCSGYAGTNAATRRAYEECGRVAPFMLGDYYPLTPYSLKLEDWIAWQFDRPELGGGMVQAFRRDKNKSLAQIFKLHGLGYYTRYEVTDLDAKSARILTGKELMEHGLRVEIPSPPGAAVVVYRKVPQ